MFVHVTYNLSTKNLTMPYITKNIRSKSNVLLEIDK